MEEVRKNGEESPEVKKGSNVDVSNDGEMSDKPIARRLRRKKAHRHISKAEFHNRKRSEQESDTSTSKDVVSQSEEDSGASDPDQNTQRAKTAQSKPRRIILGRADSGEVRLSPWPAFPLDFPPETFPRLRSKRGAKPVYEASLNHSDQRPSFAYAAMALPVDILLNTGVLRDLGMMSSKARSPYRGSRTSYGQGGTARSDASFTPNRARNLPTLLSEATPTPTPTPALSGEIVASVEASGAASFAEERDTPELTRGRRREVLLERQQSREATERRKQKLVRRKEREEARERKRKTRKRLEKDLSRFQAAVSMGLLPPLAVLIQEARKGNGSSSIARMQRLHRFPTRPDRPSANAAVAGSKAEQWRQGGARWPESESQREERRELRGQSAAETHRLVLESIGELETAYLEKRTELDSQMANEGTGKSLTRRQMGLLEMEVQKLSQQLEGSFMELEDTRLFGDVFEQYRREFGSQPVGRPGQEAQLKQRDEEKKQQRKKDGKPVAAGKKRKRAEGSKPKKKPAAPVREGPKPTRQMPARKRKRATRIGDEVSSDEQTTGAQGASRRGRREAEDEQESRGSPRPPSPSEKIREIVARKRHQAAPKAQKPRAVPSFDSRAVSPPISGPADARGSGGRWMAEGDSGIASDLMEAMVGELSFLMGGKDVRAGPLRRKGRYVRGKWKGGPGGKKRLKQELGADGAQLSAGTSGSPRSAKRDPSRVRLSRKSKSHVDYSQLLDVKAEVSELLQNSSDESETGDKAGGTRRSRMDTRRGKSKLSDSSDDEVRRFTQAIEAHAKNSRRRREEFEHGSPTVFKSKSRMVASFRRLEEGRLNLLSPAVTATKPVRRPRKSRRAAMEDAVPSGDAAEPRKNYRKDDAAGQAQEGSSGPKSSPRKTHVDLLSKSREAVLADQSAAAASAGAPTGADGAGPLAVPEAAPQPQASAVESVVGGAVPATASPPKQVVWPAQSLPLAAEEPSRGAADTSLETRAAVAPPPASERDTPSAAMQQFMHPATALYPSGFFGSVYPMASKAQSSEKTPNQPTSAPPAVVGHGMDHPVAPFPEGPSVGAATPVEAAATPVLAWPAPLEAASAPGGSHVAHGAEGSESLAPVTAEAAGGAARAAGAAVPLGLGSSQYVGFQFNG